MDSSYVKKGYPLVSCTTWEASVGVHGGQIDPNFPKMIWTIFKKTTVAPEKQLSLPWEPEI